MDDPLQEFLTETNESLDSLDAEMIQLERNPNDPGLIGNIFRLVHTIKGNSASLGLPRLEAMAHAGENVLGNFRDGSLEVSSSITGVTQAAGVLAVSMPSSAINLMISRSERIPAR